MSLSVLILKAPKILQETTEDPYFYWIEKYSSGLLGRALARRALGRASELASHWMILKSPNSQYEFVVVWTHDSRPKWEELKACFTDGEQIFLEAGSFQETDLEMAKEFFPLSRFESLRAS